MANYYVQIREWKTAEDNVEVPEDVADLGEEAVRNYIRDTGLLDEILDYADVDVEIEVIEEEI